MRIMESIRKWLYKPKRDDKSLLAQFFYADEELNAVAGELDSFDGRRDPERCTALVNRLRAAQDRVLAVTNAIMDVLIGDERADRRFRVKFPEDVLQENLAGQLWFGAECLAAGSSIMNKEAESSAMRPLAKAVTKSLENVRNLLRDACLRSNTPNGPIKLDSNELVTEMLLESLKIFDRVFAEFELSYVSAMVPVKSTQEYELQELIGVLFSETLQRALKMKLLHQDLVDDCDPALMFAIPRLAIVSGLLIFPNGPLCIDKPVKEMSEMFRPFRTLLRKIRELLWTLNKRELYMLETLLCDNEQIDEVKPVEVQSDLDDFISKFYDYPFCQDYFIEKETPVVAANTHYQQRICYVDDRTPSTSGGLLPNCIVKNSVIAAAPYPGANPFSDSSPDHQSLEAAISKSEAMLSSIMDICRKADDVESQDDSGICTETASLERSPSIDPPDSKASTSKYVPKTTMPVRKNKMVNEVVEDDLSSSNSSSTSSFYSADDEEIALALQAAEIASWNKIRAKYRSSEDLIHRLFVCIAGVADQLQTNFACDLRNILKAVFLMNASPSPTNFPPPKSVDGPALETSIEYHPSEHEVIRNNEFSVDPNIIAQEALFDTNVYFHLETDGCSDSEYSNHPRRNQEDNRSISSLASDLSRYAALREDVAQLHQQQPQVTVQERSTAQQPPVWLPDVAAPDCMGCGTHFTVVKRRHHCRHCGNIFCSRCSSNSVPLPKFGHTKPVRVCNKCFIYHLTTFTM